MSCFESPEVAAPTLIKAYGWALNRHLSLGIDFGGPSLHLLGGGPPFDPVLPPPNHPVGPSHGSPTHAPRPSIPRARHPNGGVVAMDVRRLGQTEGGFADVQVQKAIIEEIGGTLRGSMANVLLGVWK